MSRQFNGTVDRIRCAIGGVSRDGGPLTVVALWRPLAVDAGWLILTRDTVQGFDGWGVNPYSDGNVWSNFKTMPYAVSENWVIHAFSKGDQHTAPVVGHKYVYDTNTWIHQVFETVGDTFNVNIDLVSIGNDGSGGTNAVNGRLAAIGLWNRVCSVAQIESLTSSLDAWIDLTPDALWVFNQESVDNPLLDLSGNGANQTSIIGTTVSTDEPPGWSYGTVKSFDPKLSSAFMSFF